MLNRHLASLALLLTLLGQGSSAQIIGTEAFDYPDGPIDGQTGGTGFNRNHFLGTITGTTSDWNELFGTVSVQGGQLVTSEGGALREYNGFREGAGQAVNNDDDDHERSGTVRASGQVFYRFEMTRTPSAGWGGASSFDFGAERIFFGVPGADAGGDTAGIDHTGEGVSLSNIRVTDNVAYTYVAVLDFDNDLAGLFVNPGPDDYWNPQGGQNSADVTRAYTDGYWSSSVRLASGGITLWDNLVVALDPEGVGLESTVADLDSDGLPGYWETQYGLDDTDDGTAGESSPGAKDGPNGPLGDPDGDGRPNALEFAEGTNPQSDDSDGDGFKDALEGAAGTNPANPASYPGADARPGLIGVEKFDYPDGSVLGLAGGMHWDFDNDTGVDSFTGHTMTSSKWEGVGGDPQVAGGALVTRNSATDRPYGNPEAIGTVNDGATDQHHQVYYRFEMTRRAGATWAGASSYDYGAERFLFGVPGAANPASGEREFAIHDLALDEHAYSGIQPVAGQTYLLVAKIDCDANEAALYLEPDLSQPESAATPVAHYDFPTDYDSTSIRFGSGGDGDVEWDNVRVATSWAALEELPPVAVDDHVTLGHLGKARILVGANDTGSINPYTVAIESPPTHGTATLGADGGVLYQHTDSGAASDSFTYRIRSAEGDLSATATVFVTISGETRFDTRYAHLPAEPPATTLVVEDAFPGLTFDSPHGFCTVSGDTGKVFVTEGDGRVFLIPDIAAATPEKILILDLSDEVLHDNNELAMKCIAAHPHWAENGYIYVTYNSTGSTVRLSRFTCQTTPPYTAGEEQILIDQDNADIYHNIGDCDFGADGYLYVGFGDEGTQSDGFDNSQHIDKDLWSCIIRIDVDRRPENLIPNPDSDIPRVGGGSSGEAFFRIPADNPFVGATSFNGITVDPGQVRTEIYACGFRNPWQFSPEDLDDDGSVDELWVADVGRSAREEVGVYTAGQNAGWGWREGFSAGIRSGDLLNGAPESAATLTPPLWDYGHGGGAFQGASVTGGFLYRGTTFPTLTGKYLFADYVSGNIWSLERTQPEPTIERIGGEIALVALMESPDRSSILLLDRGNIGGNQGTGSIKRITVGTADTTFPRTLSATNFFADLGDLTPNPGGIAYTPNLRFWSDFAEKSRWFLIADAAGKFSYRPEASWTSPEGTVFVKHFDYPTAWETFTRTIDGESVTDRRPTSTSPRVRLETRFLVRNADGAYGISYRWNESQTDALLAENNGESFSVPITLDGVPAAIDWQIPSRSACLTCHTSEAGHSLSFNTRQLNRDGIVGPHAGNFISALELAGYLEGLTEDPATLPRHLRPDETVYSREARVRSYLEVNCAYCHQAGGTGGGSWDGRSLLTLAQTGLVHGVPVDAPLHPGDLLVTPGQVDHSILYNRAAAQNGYTRMPPLATREVDLEGLQLLAEWIASEVDPHPTYAGWRLARFGSSDSPEGAPDFDADHDTVSNHLEYLTHTDPHDPTDRWRPAFHHSGDLVSWSFAGLGDRSVRIHQSTDLRSWAPWEIPGNDGIPLDPAGIHTLQGPAASGSQFFRFDIEQR
ncbi:PQQ-dependent sugar dehydrogenase [Haloferula sargassicola]|uniref:Glucose/Sorbosone dehydrogenase domain-containing protein n=1 Tax=Haloferula sargassicola TaxID=490096 RepID=A0ABP9UNB5_9BACT